uniref:HAT C-terminal dimerisation domain-containing protein n=1 Tax=Phytophthora ramorum TaxID=164328 RepID=H3GUF5_PHYRM
MASTSELHAASSGEQDVGMTLSIESKDEEEEALALPSEMMASAASSSNSHPSAPTAARSNPGGSNNVSAVYRWYEVEESISAKKREESSIAKCKLCRQQGKLERKTCVRFSKSVTSNLWRHLKENHPDVYEKHAGEKKSVQMHRVVGIKKRGRKKKVVAPTPPATVAAVLADAAAGSIDETTGDKVQTQVQGDKGRSATAVKKAKRGDHPTHSFPDYPLGSALHHQLQAASRQMAPTVAGANARASTAAANFNPEKVREAMGYLCLYEMLPFELGSSHAFRSLMVECSGGLSGLIDDSNSFALFATEITLGYAKKMAAEVKVRTVMQMKMTDFSHLMISEWCSSNYGDTNEMNVSASTASVGCCVPSSNNDVVFLALFAVGLDQEFNPFRRCLHVSLIGSYRAGRGDSIAAELTRDKELKKAMERVAPSRYMPEIIAVEPPCSKYQSFCSDHKLHFLESVPTLLQNIMIATINGVGITDCYCLGSEAITDTGASDFLGFRNRRLDKGEYVESSSAAVAAGSSSDAFYGLSAVEIASSVLEELPTSLTGHTYRDLMNKVMYLLAHFKQSPRSRRVLRRLALEQCGLNAESYERLFIDRLRDMVISVSGICSVLSVVENMMLTLKKYFLLHKDSDSDFSKLIQLSSLSRYEWSRVRYLTVILKPFAEATAKLDGEQYVVSSLIVPSVFTLIDKLRELHPANAGFTDGSSSSTGVAEGLPEDIEALRELAFTNLSACFGHLFSAPGATWSMEKRQTFNLLWSATILDPRTRSFIIKGSLPQHDFWEIVKSEAANIAGTKVKDKDSGNDLGESSISLEDSSHLDGNVGKTLWDDLQANLASCAQEEMLLSSAKSSLEINKSSNLLEVEVSFFQEEGRIALRANPLEWWQNMRMKYPFLARLARYVLSIPCNVKVDDNPVLCDGGLVKRAPSQMTVADLCDLLAASMNLRTEKNPHFEAASKQMWSTV